MAGPRGKPPASEAPEDIAEAGAQPLADAEFDSESELADELTELDEEFDAAAEPLDSEGDNPASEAPQFVAGEVSQGDMDATRLYLNEIGFSPLLSAAIAVSLLG